MLVYMYMYMCVIDLHLVVRLMCVDQGHLVFSSRYLVKGQIPNKIRNLEMCNPMKQ